MVLGSRGEGFAGEIEEEMESPRSRQEYVYPKGAAERHLFPEGIPHSYECWKREERLHPWRQKILNSLKVTRRDTKKSGPAVSPTRVFR